MIKIPTNPITTANHRRGPATSRNSNTAKIATNRLFAKPSAVASAKGKLTNAVKPQVMPTTANITRAKCSFRKLVFKLPGKPRTRTGNTVQVMTI